MVEEDANKSGERKRGDKAVKWNEMRYIFQPAQLM